MQGEEGRRVELPRFLHGALRALDQHYEQWRDQLIQHFMAGEAVPKPITFQLATDREILGPLTPLRQLSGWKMEARLSLIRQSCDVHLPVVLRNMVIAYDTDIAGFGWAAKIDSANNSAQVFDFLTSAKAPTNPVVGEFKGHRIVCIKNTVMSSSPKEDDITSALAQQSKPYQLQHIVPWRFD